IPKLPSMRLMDIVQTIAPRAEVKIIGIRPGEKLHEELITREEAPRTKELEAYYVLEPEHPFWEAGNHSNGKPVPQDFQYGSDTNKTWLKPEELKACLAKMTIDV